MKPIIAILSILTAKAHDYKQHGLDWTEGHCGHNDKGNGHDQSPIDLPSWNMFSRSFSYEQDNFNRMYYNQHLPNCGWGCYWVPVTFN